MTPALAARIEAAHLAVRPSAVPGEYETHDRTGELVYSGTEAEIAHELDVWEWTMEADRRIDDGPCSERLMTHARAL